MSSVTLSALHLAGRTKLLHVDAAGGNDQGTTSIAEDRCSAIVPDASRTTPPLPIMTHIPHVSAEQGCSCVVLRSVEREEGGEWAYKPNSVPVRAAVIYLIPSKGTGSRWFGTPALYPVARRATA